MGWYEGLLPSKSKGYKVFDFEAYKSKGISAINDELEWHKIQKTNAIDNGLELYKIRIEDEKIRVKESLVELRVDCAKQQGDAEHDFHSKQQALGIEISKLEAHRDGLLNQISEIESMREDVIKTKDNEIVYLKEIIESLIVKLR